MTELLMIFLKAIASKLGGDAAKAIENALFGKQTSLDDIAKLITALNASVDELPTRVNHKIVQQRYQQIISTAKHNVDNNHIGGLLEFLDDSKTDSYWGVVNSVCIDMFAISATEMENKRDSPNEIDFSGGQGLVQMVNNDLIKDRQVLTQYMKALTMNSIALSAAIVAATHIATAALIKIKTVKQGEPHYQECQNRIHATSTQKYLPLINGKPGPHGFAYILAPAIRQAPRAIAEGDLTAVYESVYAGKRQYIYSQRFYESDHGHHWYIPAENSHNPALVEHDTSAGIFQLIGLPSDSVLLYSHIGYVYVGFMQGSVSQSSMGVWLNGQAGQAFKWSFEKRDGYVAYLFDSTDSNGAILSTKYDIGFGRCMDWVTNPDHDADENYWFLMPE